MPYIGINVTGSLTEKQKNTIKNGLGEKISLIPGKNESRLMIDFSENHTLYMAGNRRPLAFIDVRCYGKTEFENNKAFTEAALTLIQETLGLEPGDLYLTLTEFEHWGVMGTMK